MQWAHEYFICLLHVCAIIVHYPRFLHPESAPVTLLVLLCGSHAVHSTLATQFQAPWHPACEPGEHPVIFEAVSRRGFGVSQLAYLGEVLACHHENDLTCFAKVSPDEVQDLAWEAAQS